MLSAVETSCWIEIDNIAVCLRRTDEGVAVEMYPSGAELEEELASCRATFAGAEEVLDMYRKEDEEV